ncbi:hypothetical protein AXK11_06520 [Cephaloticoccus primus]|uniref:Uncharacterized protein n=1 Tax=Cephaloticoccus primus TaxID=1548207 RepID=A0A139SLJ8_9BACT|nr:hypothetical protein [Cephaloticoccus primus]KXU35428.1 hypothetical protein AXK11_06520 [Cephaloticoccus primus]
MLPPNLKSCALLALLSLGLALVLPGVAQAARYQTIIRLQAPDGEFVVDALPYNPNEGGSNAIHVRYRYRGIELTDIYFGHYWRLSEIQLGYLKRDEAQIRALGLNPKPGQWYEKKPQEGATLYMPPSQFSAEEVDRLAAFLRENQALIRSAFKSTDIGMRFLLFFKTSAKIQLHGIAHLVHAELPLASVSWGHHSLQAVIIEREGRVLLYSSTDKRKPAEIITWGEVLPPRKGSRKPRMILRPVTPQFDSKHIYDSKLMKGTRMSGKGMAKNLYREGRSLMEYYEILP